MTKNEALKLALEELFAYQHLVDSEWGSCRSNEQIEIDGDTNPVITALKEALVQLDLTADHLSEALKMALETLEKLTGPADLEHPYDALDLGDVTVAAIKELLAQPSDSVEQEPVAWMTQAKNFVHPSKCTKSEAELYGWKPVYTSPPKREWVGLTEEEFQWCGDENFPMIRVAEMLKEKNHD